MWVFEPVPKPSKVVCGKITSKQMVACFFCKTVHVATVPLEHRRTLNSEWYTTICLPKVFGEIRKTNKSRRIMVHHGNAISYISAQISALLTGQNVDIMGHPPYSPDLAPNDFFHFTSRYCWSVQKPCFGDVSIGVEKQTQMMVAHIRRQLHNFWQRCLMTYRVWSVSPGRFLPWNNTRHASARK